MTGKWAFCINSIISAPQFIDSLTELKSSPLSLFCIVSSSRGKSFSVSVIALSQSYLSGSGCGDPSAGLTVMGLL